MARTISAASLAKLAQNYGTEPAIIIEIEWVDGGSVYTYSDKVISSQEGKILGVSGLDNTTVIQGVQSGSSGDSQQISVKLDDTDGTIKDIIDNNDIHKRSAWVYQWFEGLATSEKFLIFKGQISSPIRWNEGDRTVSFDILTRIEDAEVGFSMEEGDFDFVPEDLVGEPWPLVFGTVKTSPALRTRSPRKAILKTGFGITDYILAPKKEQVATVCCPYRFAGFRTIYFGTNVATGGTSGVRTEPIYVPDVSCLCKKAATECELALNIAAQEPFELDELEIIDGRYFPQNTFITLDIEGAKVGGKFNGTDESPSDTFVVDNYIHPKKHLGDPIAPPITNFGCDARPDVNDVNDNDSVANQTCSISDCNDYSSGNTPSDYISYSGTTREQESWNYLATFDEAGFFWADPGSEVILDGDNELVYIANLLPSTVHQVKAYITFVESNLRQLITVPNAYYTVRQSDFNGYTTTEIVFDRPLSSRGEGWEDDIFVTQTSTVGPNPVTIMEWLIDKYTDFTYDASFASVKTTVDNYPMNFMVPGRPNILTLLQEMAFQGRMALVLRNDEFQLTYLSEEPSEVDDITEDDVLANSLILDHTDTEDLVTKFVAKWKPDLHLEDDYQLILRNNVAKYGTQSREFDFYCYNIQELVIKSATFWLIRMSNTWRKIVCKTPINKLKLETLDGVFVTLPDVASEEIKCRVETSNYNSVDKSIDFVIQTPVRSGETTAFDFHYPANLTIEDLHPTNEDLQFGNGGGSGPNVDVTAPSGHVLGESPQYGGQTSFNFGQLAPCGESDFTRPLDVRGKCRPDQGDQKPTDVDDTKPSVNLQEDNTTEPPQKSKVNSVTRGYLDFSKVSFETQGTANDLANQTTAATNTGTGSTQGAGSAGGAGNAKGGVTEPSEAVMGELLNSLPNNTELDELDKCHYDVNVFVVTTKTVRIPHGEGCGDSTCDAPGSFCYCSEQGKTGCFVGNTAVGTFERFSFATSAAAQSFQDDVDAMIYNTPATVGSKHPGFTSRINNSSNCTPVEAVSEGYEIIGYSNQDPTGNATIVGINNFLTGNFDPNEGCGV